MKLALLSNVTVELLAGMLKKNIDVYCPAGFDIWQQEMLSPTSGMYAYNPDAVVVLLHADVYANAWDEAEKGCRIIDEWCGAFGALAANLPGVSLFVSSIDISNVKCRYGAEVRLEPYFESYLIEKIQKLHSEGNNFYMLPVRETISDLGRNNFYAAKMWYVGSMPYSMKGLAELSDLIISYTSAMKGAKKKCIAVDLDNTLWGGVIGEDGVDGIVLANNKEGARYKDTQRIIKKMKDQGVMVAVLSKNNPDDVEPVFTHPDMVLQHEDFVAEMINWESKSANIRRLAAELNIGLDAFVFLDDNPVEREKMKAECPEVAVIDFPKDSSQLPDVVAKAYDQYFLSLEVTGEDIWKTSMYQAEKHRKEDMINAPSVEYFLEKMEMTMDIHFMKAEEEKRVTQLTNKTNQFNVTTKRYSEQEINALSVGEDSDVLAIHMADKYGDQGLSAVVILKYTDKTAKIDTFLMSCRVMGRYAENEIMAQVKRLLERKGIETVEAVYVRTAKNAPVSELFDKLGFHLIPGEIQENGERKDYEASVSALPETTGIFRIVTGV
jgi:FkbH-like protein